jgi:hypothetical protein
LRFVQLYANSCNSFIFMLWHTVSPTLRPYLSPQFSIS